MMRLLILLVLVTSWTGRLEVVRGQEVPKEEVQTQSASQYKTGALLSSLLVTEHHDFAVGGNLIANCWNCHEGKIALTYTPEIHKIHQGLFFAQASQADAQAVGRGRYFLTYSVHNPLGIEVGDADPALRNHLKLEENQGLVVLSVSDDSDGAKIGMKPFDVLISIDQHQISSGELLQAALKNLAEKDVTVLLMREGKMLTLSAKLPTFMTVDYEVAAMDKFDAQLVPDAPYRIGVTLKEMEAPLRLHLKLESGGLIISDIVPESPAAAAGLQPNDVLVRCNDRPINTVEEINQTIQEIKSNPAKLSLIRAGEPIEVEVTPKQEPTGDNVLQLRAFSRILAEVYRPEFIPVVQQAQLDFKIDYQAQTEPYQIELEAIQKALDDLKARIAQSNAAAREKQAEDTPKQAEPPK